MPEVPQDSLQAYCTRAVPAWHAPQASQPVSINAGWESDVYAFDVSHGPQSDRQIERLILRIYPGHDAAEKSRQEFSGMQALHRAGYPAPRVLVLESGGEPFGRPFVMMERIEGQTMWRPMFSGPPEEQRRLLTLFCELFVRLHRLSWRSYVDDPEILGVTDAFFWVDHALKRGRGLITQFGLQGFLPILDWLGERRDRVPCEQPTVVHLDFHPENILLRADGQAFVIDWTQVDISDPRFDLAWTLLLIGAYEGPAARQAVFSEYQRLAGQPVAQLEFFDVFACAKRLASVVLSIAAGAENFGMRPGAEETMKRQLGPLRGVYDLLLERTGISISEVERLFAAEAR
jgi:aminoglycoside phosphotransferase (APT) family kinase protein